MTPAEKLAAQKPKKPRRTSPDRKYPWKCGIRDERKKLGLSSQDVAKAVGISQACLIAIERGSGPNLSTAMRLAAFFGRTVEQLWEMPNK